MNHDNEAPKRWYEPVEFAEPTAKPPQGLLDGIDLDRTVHADVAEQSLDGLPRLYRKTRLLVRADTLDAAGAVLEELNDLLAGHDPQWRLERGDSRGAEVVLDLSGPEVDALAAREHLRQAKAVGELTKGAIATLALERFSFIGMPAKEGHAGTAREGVAVFSEPPPSSSVPPGGRRPVVAVLDSGVGLHPWLPEGDDGYWSGVETLVSAANKGGGDVTPVDSRLDTHFGHGTFITGILRQLAPDARVISLPVMYGDGLVEEVPVIAALSELLDRVRAATADPPRPDLFVDVVSLSFGYYSTSSEDERHTDELRELLGELGALGVRVVASAGNRHSDAPVFPAAFAAARTETLPATPLLSVGALDPDAGPASYSNFGDWVTDWAVGTAVISTVPPFDRLPEPRDPTVYDPNLLSSGFARWGGTSFAAAVLAGELAAKLCEQASETSLVDVSATATHERAHEALTAVRAETAQWKASHGVAD